MDNREYIIALYEIYKELLNEKERNYFEYYYFEDYSMQEIADLYKVSKAYASKYLDKINVFLNSNAHLILFFKLSIYIFILTSLNNRFLKCSIAKIITNCYNNNAPT